MTVFDIFVVLVLAYSTISAFLRGFLREISFLIGMIAGILIASWTYPQLSVLLSRAIRSVPAAHCVSFLLILITVVLLCALVGLLLQRTASAVGLAFFDRSLGALFGLARGSLFAVAIIMSVAAFFPASGWISGSVLAPYLLSGAHAVSFVVPQNFRQQIHDGAPQLLQRSSLLHGKGP